LSLVVNATISGVAMQLIDRFGIPGAAGRRRLFLAVTLFGGS
jgi:hypothetical protein